jgi:hypothetical protein
MHANANLRQYNILLRSGMKLLYVPTRTAEKSPHHALYVIYIVKLKPYIPEIFENGVAATKNRIQQFCACI